jgi:hypothetical protein
MKIANIHNPNAFRGEAASSALCRIFERVGARRRVRQYSGDQLATCHFANNRAGNHCGWRRNGEAKVGRDGRFARALKNSQLTCGETKGI